MIFDVLNPEKTDANSFYICQTHLYVATLPWEIQKRKELVVGWQ